MEQLNEPKTIAEYINCLSSLESNTGLLYSNIANKVEMPFVKSLFQEIAIDSQKHAVILKGISESIAQPKGTMKDCGKKIGDSWKIMAKIQERIAKKTKIQQEDLQWLSEELSFFESIMGEEYYIFVQLKTLQVLVKEINKQYNIDLGQTKNLFTKIIEDEDHHRELLETIKGLVTKKETETDNSPVVRYMNPDSWSRPMPSSS
jgi:rubrerythrin